MDNMPYSDEEPQRLSQVGPVDTKENDSSLTDNAVGNDAILRNNELLLQEYDEIQETNIRMPMKLKKCKQIFNYSTYEPLFAKDSVDDDCSTPVQEPVQDARIGKLGNIQEDSSWYDLSDSSLTSVILNPLGSGDAARRAKVREFKGNPNKIHTKEDISKASS